MTTSILVTGGTGTLGRHLTPMLRDAGCAVRVLSRRGRGPEAGVEYLTGDVLKDEGLGPALAGIGVVVHLAGANKGDDVATGHLMRAAAAARVRHVVYISVIGADRVPIGYFKAKLGAEQAVARSGVPWTTLRAAQFHDLVLTVMSTMEKLPALPIPSGVRLQPVEAREVAARLAELALGEPAGLVPDLAGPRVYPVSDLARGYFAARGKRRPVLSFRMPGRIGRMYRAGENLTLDGAMVGKRTWEEFLAERVG
jgi:uncharacterized protein YbjT (DUF2867 family)